MNLGNCFRCWAAVVAAAVFCAPASAADLIAYWNFNDLSIPTASPPGSGGVPTTIAATTGTGTLSLTGFLGNVDDFTGTSVNSIPPNTPGEESLSLIAGAGLIGNGGYLQFEFSMAGRTNLGVSYATQRTATGFNANQWSYSTDGVNFTDFGSTINPTTGYSLIGPIVTNALDNVATAYLRYTLNGATNATGNNRLDNIRLEYNASPPPPPNPPSLPQPGDIVFGLNNSSAAVTLELVRGSVSPGGGVRHPGPWQSDAFIQSVEFDNYNGVRHNARGNLLGVNFAVGGGANSGAIYSFATQGNIPAPAGQLIGNTGATNPIGHSGTLTQSSLGGLSVSPDNSKIAVVGVSAGTVIVYDYTPGDTMGAGASLANGRQTSADPAERILVTGATQGTAWKDNNTVLAFSSIGDLYEVDATTMTATFKTNVATPSIGSNWSQLAYNPDVSPYLYATYSGFSTSATPNSQSKLWVFDPSNNYALLTPAAGIDLSVSSQTAREIALDKDGNLFIAGFDSTITYIPASMAQNPSTITDNSSIFWYQSTSAATSFVGMDIGFGAGLDGDENGDGRVDAADYVSLRKRNASPAEFAVWRANFGAVGGSGSALAGNAAVPEPTSLVSLVLGVAACLACRRRGR